MIDLKDYTELNFEQMTGKIIFPEEPTPITKPERIELSEDPKVRERQLKNLGCYYSEVKYDSHDWRNPYCIVLREKGKDFKHHLEELTIIKQHICLLESRGFAFLNIQEFNRTVSRTKRLLKKKIEQEEEQQTKSEILSKFRRLNSDDLELMIRTFKHLTLEHFEKKEEPVTPEFNRIFEALN